MVSILLCTKLVEDVKLTRYSICDALTALKIAVINAKKPVYPWQMLNESTWFKGKCTPFYSCFSNYWRLAHKISAYEACIICPKLFVACKIHCKSPSRQPDDLTTLDWFTVHEGNLSANVTGISICAEPCGMWKSASDSGFACPTNISKTQKRCK